MDSKNLIGIQEFTFREGQIVYINEAGLYSLILSSKAPFAKEFIEVIKNKHNLPKSDKVLKGYVYNRKCADSDDE